jgi:hypothetical protein
MLTTALLTTVTILLAAPPGYADRLDTDWLVTPVRKAVTVEKSDDGREIVMDNGLIRRTFRLTPNTAAVALDNLMTGESMLRGVKPEARLTIDGISFDIGGLKGQPNYAYLLDEWKDNLTSDPNAWQFIDCQIDKTRARFPWKRVRHCVDLPWPPPGASLTMAYGLSEQAKKTLGPGRDYLDRVAVQIHYEMYEGIPLMCKWLTIHNGSDRPIRLNRFTSEILATVEYESEVDRYERWNVPNLHVESDYAFAGMNASVPSLMASLSHSSAFSRNLSMRIGRSGVTSVAAPM